MPNAWQTRMMKKEEWKMARRVVTLAFSSCLMLSLGLVRVDQLFAQVDAKKGAQETKPQTTAKEAAKADAAQTKKAETTKTEPPKPTEPPLPPIPQEVTDKVNAAWRAVAEAIVAAQDAGLVETSIDPPPILDILITSRATDARTLKNTIAKKPYGVSPEVFGAWFTGFGKMDGINYDVDVRIINPSAGLKQWYETRARKLDQSIQEVRKAKGQTTTKKPAAKPAEPPKADIKKVGEPKK